MIYVNPKFFEFEPVKIANVGDNGDIQTELKRHIAIYEKKCLIEVLGECLFKELQESYTFASGAFALKLTATEPIKRLIQGYEYTKPEPDSASIDFWRGYSLFGCGCGCGSSECDKRVWKGIVQEDDYLNGQVIAKHQRSFIADYIYYFYLLDNRTVTAGTGQVQMGSENGTTLANFSKRIDRWNEFIFQVIGRKNETSLWQFLHDNKADYPTWEPNCNLYFKEKY